MAELGGDRALSDSVNSKIANLIVKRSLHAR